ncbi:MAG TPA: STM3941 family protein [Ktedonobacterales bacterium]
MITSQPLRLYANPVKLLLLLLGSAVFVLIGFLMLQDAKVRSDASQTAMAYVAIAFFGLCSVVFIIMIVRDTVFRLPVLQIDGQRWNYKSPLGGKAQAVPWQNIRAIALFRQKLPRTSTYYLVVYARDPQQAPRPRTQAFTARFYPSLSGAAMSVPLNTLFVRTTPSKSKRLLERIVSTCAHEMQLHRVQVSGEMYDM